VIARGGGVAAAANLVWRPSALLLRCHRRGGKLRLARKAQCAQPSSICLRLLLTGAVFRPRGFGFDREAFLLFELGLNKREARELVDLFFEELRASLATGEQIKLSGFGNFDLRDKNQRPGRNPKTGEEIPICARRVVTFRPGQKLKARVEAYAGSRE